jgi:arsenate reductase
LIPKTITLYGIPNCDQVKKARSWLNENQISINFHDFKKAGVTPALVNSWLQHLDWQHFLNRRGTTWRQLTEIEQKAVINAESATHCMVRSPSIIKRPVLVITTQQQVEIVVGFSIEDYQRVFASLN